MIYLISIAIWLFMVWHLIAKRFPDDGPQLPRWTWFIPFIPIIYGLMFITALIEVCIALMVGGIIYNIQQKLKKTK